MLQDAPPYFLHGLLGFGVCVCMWVRRYICKRRFRKRKTEEASQPNTKYCLLITLRNRSGDTLQKLWSLLFLSWAQSSWIRAVKLYFSPPALRPLLVFYVSKVLKWRDLPDCLNIIRINPKATLQRKYLFPTKPARCRRHKQQPMTNMLNLLKELRALSQHFLIIPGLLKHIQPLCCVKHKQEKKSARSPTKSESVDVC